MGKRFGIGALAVAALIAAGPASAQLSAKPAVGTVIGLQSAMYAPPRGLSSAAVTGRISDNDDLFGWNPSTVSFVVGGVVAGSGMALAMKSRANPGSP